MSPLVAGGQGPLHPTLRTNTSGVFHQAANIQLRQLMKVSSWEQLFSDLGKKYGRLGLLVNAPSSCGLLPMIDAGLLITLSAVASLMLKTVLCVIRHQCQLTIFLWAAPLQGNSGFISFHFTSDLQTFPPAF
jgi:hypothetical protein